MAGNTGFQMGGWFKSPVGSLDDLQAVKIRAAGLGAEVYRRLGMTAIVLSPGEIFTALQSGLIDAVEFLGPTSDVALGFQRVAPYYVWPSFNKPNGTGEAIVALSAVDALDADLSAIIAGACALEASAGLAEADWNNGAAIAELAAGSDVTLAPWPEDVIAAARGAAQEVLTEVGATDGRAGEVLRAYEAAIGRLGGWSARSIGPYLAGRAPAA
jgi:TRAP-type mannitol/chloroaromatic compound transport system substrate-binding protein